MFGFIFMMSLGLVLGIFLHMFWVSEMEHKKSQDNSKIANLKNELEIHLKQLIDDLKQLIDDKFERHKSQIYCSIDHKFKELKEKNENKKKRTR